MSDLKGLELKLDATQVGNFIRFYKTLPEKPKTTIQFFERGDVYSVHGDDATFLAKEAFKGAPRMMEKGADKLSYILINKTKFEKIIKDLLLVKQYRVEIFVDREKDNQNWTLEYKGSPGNLQQFESILFTTDIVVSTSVIAIRISTDSKSKVVGLAHININERTISIVEFAEDDLYSNLESLVVQLGPKECIVPSDFDISSVKQIFERIGVPLTTRKKSEFTSEALETELNVLLNREKSNSSDFMRRLELQWTTAATSLGALISYLELMKEQEHTGQFLLDIIDLKRYVRLDAAAMEALNLLSERESSADSLLALLNKCRTPQGYRLLVQWVKQPLQDINLINERLDVVESLVISPETRRTLLEEYLRRIPDLQVFVKRLNRKNASLSDLYRIYLGLLKIPQLANLLEEMCNPTVLAMFVEPLKSYADDLQRYIGLTEATIDLENAEKGDFFVKAGTDEELTELRASMDEDEATLRQEMISLSSELGLEPGRTIKLENNPQTGFAFRITLKSETCLRNKSKYKIIDTSKGGVRFVTSKVTLVNERYLQSRQQYEEKQRSAVKVILDVAREYCDMLFTLNSVIARLDVLASFAEVSATAPQEYTRPILHPQGSRVLELREARHPCLEICDGVSYVPNSVAFSEDTTFYVITGPNMGGKSTFMRSVAVCVFMAQVGCFVPCDRAEISVVDAIFARIGAGDDLNRGVSTFMQEMMETSSILKSATKNSFVVIDELGRGTSTYEGCGIAWSISEFLSQQTKCFTLLATHFDEITKLAQEHSNVKNLHVNVLIEEDNLTMLYSVLPGPSSRSFGIQVAKVACLPDDVIQDAKLRLTQFEADYLCKGERINSEKMKTFEQLLENDELVSSFLGKCKAIVQENIPEEEMLIKLKKKRDEITALLNSDQ